MFFFGFSMKKNNHFYWGYPHDLGTPPLSKSSWKHHFRGGLPWPSGNQTWHWKLPCVDHWFIKSSTYSGFPVAMFDYRRVYGTVAPCQDPEFPFAIDENIIYMGSNNIAMFDMMTLWGISWCFRGDFPSLRGCWMFFQEDSEQAATAGHGGTVAFWAFYGVLYIRQCFSTLKHRGFN